MPIMTSAPIVQASSLHKQVSTGDATIHILKNINFDICAGETVAITGASGSGKSTLLGLLAGLDLPSAGTVRLDGTDLFNLDEDGRAALRARLIGFVFQAFQLLPALTALENVMLPLELGGCDDARKISLAVLDRVGLGHRLGHYPRQLSGGEQQRVAIARAFVREPRILMADEPTGNLDQQTGENIIELLFELNRERAATLVLVTHDSAVSIRCRRQLRLVGGCLLAEVAA